MTHDELTAHGSACHAAAISLWASGFSPIGLCVPGHVGVRHVNPRHLTECTDKDAGKRPMWEWARYQTEQPTLEELADWWRQFPYGNVGLILGRVIRIDADGEKGAAKLQEWSGGDLPDTWAFQSPASRTPQYLYRMPDGLEPYRTTRKQNGPGHNELALMALGGQTVLPPSLHPGGGAYIWLPGHGPDDLPMAEAPAWLLGRLAQTGRKTNTRRKTADTEERRTARSLALDDLKIAKATRELIRDGGAPDGHRSLALYAVYCAMDAAGYTDEEIADVVTHPDNGISAKPLEQRDPRRWVLGDIERVLSKRGQDPPEYGDDDVAQGDHWEPDIHALARSGHGVRRQHGIRVRRSVSPRRLIRTVDATEVHALWR